MNYRGYKIEKVVYQGCDNYKVTSPNWSEIAANIKTAKKWVDAEIADKNLNRL